MNNQYVIKGPQVRDHLLSSAGSEVEMAMLSTGAEFRGILLGAEDDSRMSIRLLHSPLSAGDFLHTPGIRGEYTHKGKGCAFVSRVVLLLGDVLRVLVPESITVRQRRSHARWRLPIDPPMEVRMMTSSGSVPGQVRDISEGGLCFYAGEILSAIEPLREVTIHLPKGKTLIVDRAYIRHHTDTGSNLQHKKHLYGMEFTAMKNEYKNLLGRFVHAIGMSRRTMV